MDMSPSFTVHGGQHDTKYVTFELLTHAAFVADEIWGFMREPARSRKTKTSAFFRVVTLLNTGYLHLNPNVSHGALLCLCRRP